MFLIRIEGETISCLGIQFLDILKTLSDQLKDLYWYGADVEINGAIPFKLKLHGYAAKKIGTLNDLIELCCHIDQFNSGVFFAANDDMPQFCEIEISTEDEEFRAINGSILEIRAFDTSYFEIYTEDINIVNALKNRYQTKFNVSKDTDVNRVYLQMPIKLIKDLKKHHPLRCGKATT